MEVSEITSLWASLSEQNKDVSDGCLDADKMFIT
jgi:hypothetical protein